MWIAFNVKLRATSQAPAPGPAVPEHWPTNGWQWASPESQGIDSDALVDLLAFAAREDLGVHDIVIVRHGLLVFDAVFYPYDGETPHDVASVTKSVTTTLLGAAMQEGLLDGLDLDYVEPAGSNAFNMRAEFEADQIRLSVSDRTGLFGEHMLLGQVRDE